VFFEADFRDESQIVNVPTFENVGATESPNMLESRTLVIFTFTSAPTTIRGRKYCFPTMKSDNLNCISCFNAMYRVKHPSARRLNHAQMAHFGQNDCKCLEMCNIRQHADARRSAET